MLYAYNSDRSREAQGTLQNIQIGGTDPDPAADNTGPSIELFMGDSTFVNGGYANSNTFLLGKLYDKNGINISGYGTGELKAKLPFKINAISDKARTSIEAGGGTVEIVK